MYLSVQSAQQIAAEISTIVKQHVNMMDENGYIIASTNPERIGNFHAGAKKIIDEYLPELYVTKEEETVTTRAGLNLPISIEEKIIGVVGITGQYEQVFNYGQIVKKMTEILVRESYAQEQERLDKKIENRFLEDWILGAGIEKGQAFVERGIALHIDILRPRRVMVLRLENFQVLSGTNEGQKLIEKVEKIIRQFIYREKNNVFLRLTTKQICLISPRNDEQMKMAAQNLIELIRKSCGVELLIGIDDNSAGTINVNNAYAKANKASHACRAPVQRVTLYSQITMEIFIEDISKAAKKEYLERIFRHCSFGDMRRWIHLLEIYFEHEGSIERISAELFMHKNTLQYKLKKLKAITGYDVRLPSNCALFYIAIQFFQDIQKDYLLLDK